MEQKARIYGQCDECGRHLNKNKTKCNKCATKVIKDSLYYKKKTYDHFNLFYTYSRNIHIDPVANYHLSALRKYFQR